MYITYLSFDRQSDAAILSRCRFKTPPDPRRSIYLFRFFIIISHDMHTVQKAFCLSLIHIFFKYVQLFSFL